MTRIALIHATRLAMEPVETAFAALWPQADVVGLLDEALSADRASGRVGWPVLAERVGRLGDLAAESGADGILYTCSAFGPAIDTVAGRLPVPVLKPNEAMFAEAIATGGETVLLVTFPPSADSMAAEFAEAAKGSGTTLRPVLVEGALDALHAGDAARHHALCAEAAAREAGGASSVMLAQFSMAPAAGAVRNAVPVPVLTSPEAAVTALRARVGAPSQ